jgi:hypothetical protein
MIYNFLSNSEAVNKKLINLFLVTEEQLNLMLLFLLDEVIYDFFLFFRLEADMLKIKFYYFIFVNKNYKMNN